ncbi:hypothetical protein [uncultured Methylobacterium sp.]|uniref:hypothetical protein n=1 Tax=uncultured Methylobacterium sp. TaxID=157278 RepID=UPI002619D795|nr:hypothetical protein [uncultured Methylobacterium sp.]
MTAALTSRTRTSVKVPFALPIAGMVWVAVNKSDFLNSLVRNYDFDEETGLTAEWDDRRHTYFVRPTAEDARR